MRVELGHSAAELTGPWRFHLGDNEKWAEPAFDDSAWEAVDLTPPPGSSDADLGTSGFVPGWTADRHPQDSGFAWYRLHVVVSGSKTQLALKMPNYFDDAYQVFVNGRQVGQFGTFHDRRVTTFSALPRGFLLPSGLREGPVTIAIRMWMDSATPLKSPDAGGLHGPPVLGHAAVIMTQVRLDWDEIAHDVGSGFLETLVLLLALAVALTHFWMDRTDKAYLWLALVAFVTLLGNAVLLLDNFIAVIPQSVEVLLTDVLVAPIRIGLWVLFWAYWFQVGPSVWLQRSVWGLVSVLAGVNLLLLPPFLGSWIPLHSATVCVAILLVGKLLLAGLLLWVVYHGIRRHRSEGWLALPAVLLAAMAIYQHELSLIHIPIQATVLGFSISLGTASTMLSLLLITLMLSQRFLRSQRQKVQWRLELAQAREVQQLLIPQHRKQIRGFSIESEYRPAREVGGDFFQIIPGEEDGSVLLVVGDVTGKGLCAGMMVALILGVLQTAVKNNHSPESVLRTLNQTLCEGAHATATCLILRIAADGVVSVANAGHLAPYLNGKEVSLDGALPLGVLGEVDYPATTFLLNPGDALWLMSDGIVEAQNAKGELFGFDRLNRLLQKPLTASALASAAEEFGQEDDILVMRVERLAAVTSMSSAPALRTPSGVALNV